MKKNAKPHNRNVIISTDGGQPNSAKKPEIPTFTYDQLDKECRPFVYIAGPLSSDTKDKELGNVNRAIHVSQQIKELGILPIVPHLSYFWNERSSNEYGFWMNYSANLIRRCIAVFVIPGKSVGVEIEIKFALEIGKPVFSSLTDLIMFVDKWNQEVSRISESIYKI